MEKVMDDGGPEIFYKVVGFVCYNTIGKVGSNPYEYAGVKTVDL